MPNTVLKTCAAKQTPRTIALDEQLISHCWSSIWLHTPLLNWWFDNICYSTPKIPLDKKLPQVEKVPWLVIILRRILICSSSSFLLQFFYEGFPVCSRVFFMFSIDSFRDQIQNQWFWTPRHFSVPFYRVDDSCLAHSSVFSFTVIPEWPGIQYTVNVFLSASTYSSTRHSQNRMFWVYQYLKCSLVVCENTKPFNSLMLIAWKTHVYWPELAPPP